MLVRSGKIPSPRQTSIDKTNDCAKKSERGAFVRSSDPPSGHSVHKTGGDTWRAPARRLIQTQGSQIGDNGNAVLQNLFPNYSKTKSVEDTLVSPLWGKRGKKKCFLRIVCSRCCTRRNLRFHDEHSQHADQKQLTRR